MTSVAPVGISNQLTAGAVTIYTSPAGATYSLVKTLTLTNTDTVAHMVTVNLVRSGGTAGPTNILTANANVPPEAQNRGVALCPEWNNQVLNPGDFISAAADTAAKVNLMVSLLQIQN